MYDSTAAMEKTVTYARYLLDAVSAYVATCSHGVLLDEHCNFDMTSLLVVTNRDSPLTCMLNLHLGSTGRRDVLKMGSYLGRYCRARQISRRD